MVTTYDTNNIKRLGQHGITPKEFVCSNDTRNLLKNLNFIRRTGAGFVESGNAPISIVLPAMFFIERPGDEPHVWCVPDPEKFTTDYKKHVGDEDKIVLVAPLKKELK